ncbi:MAG TPA: hypothetical protein VMW67_04280 [Desulfobacteria bacterium]|nr:hypothetical protein [Desulfobacteria bacterium]
MGIFDKIFGSKKKTKQFEELGRIFGTNLEGGLCDICNKNLGPREGTIVSISEMKIIAKNGFRPHQLGLIRMAAFLGIPKEAADNDWCQRVLADTTHWVLCETCYSKTRPYAR